MTVLIVNTPMVKVIKTDQGYEMFITCKDGSIVEHEPFKNDLEGMVSAISLSAEICAGKFFLKGIQQSKHLRLNSKKVE